MTRTRTACCACGRLSITVAGAPLGVGVCHCLACQRRTGSAFATLAVFAAPFAVSGEAREFARTGDQGAVFRFQFCPHCGTSLFSTEDGVDGRVSVAVGAFVDADIPAPEVSVYECRRHPWVGLPGAVTRFDRDPD